MKADQSCDLIVIGAGLGAMTAAAIAARRGRKVLVIEKHKVLGGYASVFARKGQRFDISLHQIGGVRNTCIREILREAGILEHLHFIKWPSLTVIHRGGGKEDLTVPNGDAKAFEQILRGRFPQERWAIWLWFRIMHQIRRQTDYWDKIRRAGPVHQGVRIFFAPIFALFLALSRLVTPKLAWLLRTQNPELRRILLHFSAYYGLPAEEINAFFPMIANSSYYCDGGYYIRGGGYEIVRQLSRVIRAHGGTILPGQQADEILTEGNRVTGIRMLRAGEMLTCKAPAILCGANPFVVYEHLLSTHPRAQRELLRLRKLRPGITASVLFMRIRVPAERLNPALAGVYELYEPPAGDERAWYQRFRNRGFDEGGYEQDGISLTIHSNADPEALSREGGALLNLFFCDNHKRWAQLSEPQYQAQKAIETGRMLDAAEKHLPGLREHIDILELATPRTMAHFTSNPGGAIYGFAQTPAQALHRRFSIRSPL